MIEKEMIEKENKKMDGLDMSQTLIFNLLQKNKID